MPKAKKGFDLTLFPYIDQNFVSINYAFENYYYQYNIVDF